MSVNLLLLKSENMFIWSSNMTERIEDSPGSTDCGNTTYTSWMGYDSHLHLRQFMTNVTSTIEIKHEMY